MFIGGFILGSLISGITVGLVLSVNAGKSYDKGYDDGKNYIISLAQKKVDEVINEFWRCIIKGI